MVVSIINSSVSNKIHYNLFKSEGGPNPKLDTDILDVMPIKQEHSSKSSFPQGNAALREGSIPPQFIVLC